MIKQTKSRIAAAVLLMCMILMAGLWLPSKRDAAYAAKLNKTSLLLLKGSSMQLKLKKAEGEVKWKSKKKSVARVSRKGVVTGVGSGSCTIVATCEGKSYKCRVTVKALKNVNTMGALKGIDVSYWQGSIDFKKVKKDGISFVIMRAGHGYDADTTFERNYKAAKENGLLVGCYWFITSTSKSGVKAQANLCLKTIKGKTFDFPVFVDIESNSQFNLGKTFCSTQVDTFCKMVKKAGYWPGWYTSASFVKPYLTNKVANKSGYASWVASWRADLDYDKPCDFWQYSNTGRISGINTNVDLNWYFPNAREPEE